LRQRLAIGRLLAPERDALVKKAGQAENAGHLDDWANLKGLQPPK
jgi:hypothetical protein